MVYVTSLTKNIGQTSPPVKRPDVLNHLPRSCALVFDLVASYGGSLVTSWRGLASSTRLSLVTVQRAVRRLQAVHLLEVRSLGRGRGARTQFRLRWRFPQGNVLPTGDKSSKVFPETRRYPSGSAEKVFRWVMWEVRRDLRERPSICARRRACIMDALAPPVRRALEALATPAERRVFLGRLLDLLDLRRGLGQNERPTRRWAVWAVRAALREALDYRERMALSARFLSTWRTGRGTPWA